MRDFIAEQGSRHVASEVLYNNRNVEVVLYQLLETLQKQVPNHPYISDIEEMISTKPEKFAKDASTKDIETIMFFERVINYASLTI